MKGGWFSKKLTTYTNKWIMMARIFNLFDISWKSKTLSNMLVIKSFNAKCFFMNICRKNEHQLEWEGEARVCPGIDRGHGRTWTQVFHIFVRTLEFLKHYFSGAMMGVLLYLLYSVSNSFFWNWYDLCFHTSII